MTSRRRFVLATLIAASGARAAAQPRQAKIGFLLPFAPNASPTTVTLLRRLEEHGYRAGRTATYESRSTDGVAERYQKFARELIDAKCELIFTLGPEAGPRALLELRSTIPVVFMAVDFDPVEKRIIESLRRPGANITGVYAPTGALGAKRLEVARELLPGANRFLVIADMYSRDQLAALRDAAEAHGVRLVVTEFAQPPYDYAQAFRAGRQSGVQAFLPVASPIFFAEREKIGDHLAAERLPAIGVSGPFADSGWLLGYGVDIAKFATRAADIGARILKGAKAGDIPVEQTDEYEVVLNLKTAKILGLKIPHAVMARATRLIE